ncbi:conjugative transposon protein TraM [Flavobacterium sp. ST-75]|uniref:Conjugative transposon protein TraM n=1 Tax=Flavobacterium rhizophilum TaxID=3163296 RepID=A0ABW8YC41_9FLAO
MRENSKDKTGFLTDEGTTPSVRENRGLDRERLKKPLIFGVMGIIFAACLYLIFAGEKGQAGEDMFTNGINDKVPQASGAGLPDDKGKAYQQEMLREKDRLKREALMTLSDYWHPDNLEGIREPVTTGEVEGELSGSGTGEDKHPTLGSYRSMRHSLSTFYQGDPAQDALLRENEKLKAELRQQESKGDGPDRLELMERSYQMAAKYFPGVSNTEEAPPGTTDTEAEEAPFLEVLPEKKNIVSRLGQRAADSVALRRFAEGSYSSFMVNQESAGQERPANSIRACIHRSAKITGEGSVQLRLLQAARLGGVTLPKGYILTAVARFQSTRLQLQVFTVAVGGNIFPVNLSVYDIDGQKGLNLPYTAEVTAVNGTLANMGNSAGSGITINQSALQQLTSDAARGLIQGVSGYFSKKVKPQKATLRAGFALFLVSKEK